MCRRKLSLVDLIVFGALRMMGVRPHKVARVAKPMNRKKRKKVLIAGGRVTNIKRRVRTPAKIVTLRAA